MSVTVGSPWWVPPLGLAVLMGTGLDQHQLVGVRKQQIMSS